jgi:hypothetical protein
MRSTIRRTFLLAAACLLAGQSVWGQQDAPESHAMPRLEVAVLYDALLSNVVRADRFWMQGGGIQIEGQFWHGLGAEADISGFHAQNANNAGVGLDMVTATFGPRYLWSPADRRCSFFGHALVGEANGFNSLCKSAGAWIWRSSIVFPYVFSRPTGYAPHCRTRTLTSKTIFAWRPESSFDFDERLPLSA